MTVNFEEVKTAKKEVGNALLEKYQSFAVTGPVNWMDASNKEIAFYLDIFSFFSVYCF